MEKGMVNPVNLAILDVAAIASCTYGIFSLGRMATTTGSSISMLGVFYFSIWFGFGLISKLCQLVALYKIYLVGEDQVTGTAKIWSRCHYLLIWVSFVIGYPTFVTQVWNYHHPSSYVHFHIVLAVIPHLAVLISRKTSLIVTIIKIANVAAILSHGWITFLASQIWGMAGAGVMALNLLVMSIPTVYNLWGFSSRELSVVGFAVASYLFSCEVSTLALPEDVVKVENIWPF